jgi:RsiW-degrading membrane proteinase PrsW (M82 family)
MMTRAELHHLSRDSRYLLRGCAILCGGGFLIALLISYWQGSSQLAADLNARTQQVLAEHVAEVEATTTPRELSHVLRQLYQLRQAYAETDSASKGLPLLGLQPPPLQLPDSSQLEKHITQVVPDDSQRAVFLAFVALLTDAPNASSSALTQATQQTPPVPCAHEFLAELLRAAGDEAAALSHFMAEARQQGATQAGREAIVLALDLQDVPALAQLQQETDAFQHLESGWDLCEVGMLLEQPLLQWQGAAQSLMGDLSLPSLGLSLLAALIWIAILWRYQSTPSQRSWWWIALPILAGVLSIIPTTWLSIWQEVTQGMTGEGSSMQKLQYFVLGVGLREELAKLLLVVPFLPWLLKQKSAGLALMVGGYVGLGFAWEENISYLSHGSSSTAYTRLITANFMHISMTALCALALYDLARSKFGSAPDFLLTFATIVIAHGFYDWAFTGIPELRILGCIDMLSLVTLALLARQFFRSVSLTLQPKAQPLSAVALLVWGASALLAIGFISSAFSREGLMGLSIVGDAAISMVPLVIMHARHLEQV